MATVTWTCSLRFATVRTPCTGMNGDGSATSRHRWASRTRDGAWAPSGSTMRRMETWICTSRTRTAMPMACSATSTASSPMSPCRPEPRGLVESRPNRRMERYVRVRLTSMVTDTSTCSAPTMGAMDSCSAGAKADSRTCRRPGASTPMDVTTPAPSQTTTATGKSTYT